LLISSRGPRRIDRSVNWSMAKSGSTVEPRIFR
jgi:hypothetical protein